MLTSENYREYPALNQTKIKDIIGNNFRERKGQTEEMLLGNMTDTILEGPHLLKERYAVMSVKIGEKPKKIADYLLSAGVQSLEEVNDFTLYSYFELEEYNNRYKDPNDPRRKDVFLKEADEYFTTCIQNIGKTPVTEENIEKAQRAADDIKTGKFTKGFLSTPLTVYNQLPILFNIQGVECKGLIDYAIKNETEQSYIIPGTGITILPGHILPIDFKTTSDHSSNFHKSVRRYRADLQGAFYSEGLSQVFDGYTIDDFVFLVASIGFSGCAYPYMLSPKDAAIGKYGANKVSGVWEIAQQSDDGVPADSDIKGYERGVYLFKQHLYYDQWDYSIEQYENPYLFTSAFYD